MNADIKEKLNHTYTCKGFVAVVNEKLQHRYYGTEYRVWFDWVSCPSAFLAIDNSSIRIVRDLQLVMPYGMFDTREKCESAVIKYVEMLRKAAEENNRVKETKPGP